MHGGLSYKKGPREEIILTECGSVDQAFANIGKYVYLALINSPPPEGHLAGLARKSCDS